MSYIKQNKKHKQTLENAQYGLEASFNLGSRTYDKGNHRHPKYSMEKLSSLLKVSVNLVPRSLVDEAEGEIWPNPICITRSPVRNVTGEASAHAQYKFGAVKADFVAYNKLTPCLRHDLVIFARISKFRCFHETKQTQIEFERFFLQLGRICFRILLRESENFSDFCKVWSQFAFRDMIVPFYASSSTRALKFSSISHTSFLT